ncbi:MAG: hypothetical protein FJX75_29435, partial [Armatimonadetes bacterium]|nr:hypothetical protein [Armatimonadota bacterium]
MGPCAQRRVVWDCPVSRTARCGKRGLSVVDVAGSVCAPRTLWPLGLLLLASSSLAQQPSSLQPRISPDTITVGDLLTYTVEVPLAADERITGPGAEAAFGRWEVRGYHVEPAPGKAVVSYTLTAFETGKLPVPSIEITVGNPAGKTRSVRTAAVTATIASVLKGEDTRPADIVGPLTLREKPLAIALRVLVGVVIVAAVVLLGVFLWQRKRRLVEKHSRPDPADVVALKALKALREAGLPEAGRVKQHYCEVSDILRTYLAARWGLRTLEETTWRIVAQMRDTRTCAEYAPVVDDLLRQADL